MDEEPVQQSMVPDVASMVQPDKASYHKM
jgi:hypothetical protein